MLDFCYLILIILEISATVFFVRKLIALEKKVDEFHEKFLLIATEVLIVNDKIRESIQKINKVFKFITNKRLYQTIDALKITFNTIQIILLIHSFDYSKNKKLLNYKNIKKLFLSEIIRMATRKIILATANLV